jgi:putative drug exporter of the RND superfamily
MLEALGRTVFHHARLTLVLAGLLLAASVLVLVRGGRLTTAVIHGLEGERADALAAEVLGHAPDVTFVAIFQDPEIDARDEKFQVAMKAALDPLRDDPRVLSVESPDDAPPFRAPQMVNGPAHAAVALITLRGDLKDALRAYPDVRARLAGGRMHVRCTGHVPFTSDLDRTLQRDLIRAEIVSLPLAILVLLWVFRTGAAALLPVGVGALAVAAAIALVFAISGSTDVAQYTVNVCSLVGLGVAIDYSLFTTSRYREELAAGHGYEEALVRTMGTAGRMVVFAGLAAVMGLGGLFFFERSYMFAMGIGGTIVVALAVVFALTFLPALLAVLGPRVDAWRLPFAPKARTSGGWRRAAAWVMRHPIGVLVPTLVVLLGMGTPFLRLRVGAADVRVLAADAESRAAYDMLGRDFPDLARPRVLLAVRFPSAPALTVPRIDALYDLSRRVAALPGVVKVESIVDGDQPLGKEDLETALLDPPPLYAYLIELGKKLTVGERTVLLYAAIDAEHDSRAARELVRTLRAERAVGDGELLVGGQAATDVDTTDYLAVRTPRAIAFVVGTTLVVLFLLLGSVVLPIKAVVMNVLSIAGSFGALVWVFQEGHLFVREPRPIEPSVPIILFCALFGLSMDYEVLMLSRIKESYERTGDNTHAVGDGLEKTAGLITSAAAIMVVVFSAFAMASVVILQAFGATMALAVALDATLVRVLLVPATMRLFGSANWWAPRPLRALRKFLGFG